jgi:hypothetical protein
MPNTRNTPPPRAAPAAAARAARSTAGGDGERGHLASAHHAPSATAIGAEYRVAMPAVASWVRSPNSARPTTDAAVSRHSPERHRPARRRHPRRPRCRPGATATPPTRNRVATATCTGVSGSRRSSEPMLTASTTCSTNADRHAHPHRQRAAKAGGEHQRRDHRLVGQLGEEHGAEGDEEGGDHRRHRVSCWMRAACGRGCAARGADRGAGSPVAHHELAVDDGVPRAGGAAAQPRLDRVGQRAGERRAGELPHGEVGDGTGGETPSSPSRPRHPAPPSVAISSAMRAVPAWAPSRSLASSIA